jgi:copper homeostasis protein
MMKVEVVAYSLASCLAAQEGGASRVELCSSPYEGGTTPSAGLVALARKYLHIDLFVMIRPRGGDFCYDAIEFETMQADIEAAKQMGANGVVFGILSPDGTVDVARTKQLVALAHPLEVTFHRAFDMTRDPFEALEAVIETGAARILTSGHQPHAINGATLLAQLVERNKNRIELMAGSGVNAQNALELIQTGVHALHLSGKGSYQSAMDYRNLKISMGGFPQVDEYELSVTNAQKVREVVELIGQLN